MRRDYSVSRLKAWMCRQAYCIVQGWSICVLAWTAAGCSVDTVSAGDAAMPPGSPDVASLAPDAIIQWPDAAAGGDGACRVLACNSAGAQYCGDIPNCGQTLHCGQCPSGLECKNSICAGNCVTCNPAGGDYCGTIGDNCGGSLDCPATCPKAGWTCTDHICTAQPPFCTPVTCATTSGDHYCDKIGNGCGGSLDCGNDCPTGWDCVNNICVGKKPICNPLSCTTPTGDHYCGTVGDGCGGTLTCGDDCPAGWTCDTDHICKGLGGVCTPSTCDPAGGHYCGKVGDGCGGTLDCPAVCANTGWDCVDRVCKGSIVFCEPLKCETASGDNYCGTVGDGCGGSLDCPLTCPKTGWTCDTDSICKGALPVCSPLSCTTPSGDSYCGTVGDQCGGTLDCPLTCPKAGWTCDTTKHICKAQPPVCTQVSCDAASGDHYCGPIGDGCGGSLDCEPPVPRRAGRARTACAGAMRQLAMPSRPA